VVGANDLALRVCEELYATEGHEVVVMWPVRTEIAARVERIGAAFEAGEPTDVEALQRAGIAQAACIIPVCDDDRLNLQAALKARDVNPEIRVVLRQFNRRLGRKIEQNLPDCTALSPATHAAATFAAAALDSSCLYGVQFPSAEGPLLGFSERSAREFGLDDTTIGEAEQRLGLRIVSVNGALRLGADHPIRPDDAIAACGTMRGLQRSFQRRGSRMRSAPRARTSVRDVLRAAARLEPLLLYTFGAGLLLYACATLYFMSAMHLSPIESLYFVAATMFTVGYGDITPHTRNAQWPAYLAAIGVMGVGVTIGGVFIATIAAALNRAQETALRGLRRIHAEGHIVVCGAGNVGTRVIEFLLDMDQRVVVIEPQPNAIVLELARTRRVELLASDATDDETLAFCDLHSAAGLVAVTDSDTANLEAALGALVYNPQLPVVMRIQDPEFSRSIARNFRIARSFSATDLTAPALAGLARFPASRGRVTLGGETFNIGERGAEMHIPRAGGIPLYLWREGKLVPVHDYVDMRPSDRLLDVVPLSKFKAQGRAEKETPNAASG